MKRYPMLFPPKQINSQYSLTSSTDEEAVADGDNYDIADDEEYYANAGADV